jgi:hypothetical protein
MSFSTRTTALAAALCTFACGSFAETISINFGTLGGVASPIEVTELKGFKVSGAYAYDVELLTTAASTKDFYADIENDFPKQTSGGFLLNKDGSSSSSKTSRIVFSIPSAGTSYAGQYITSLTYSWWAVGGALGVDGCNVTCTNNGMSNSSGIAEWPKTPESRKFSADDKVSRVEFFAKNNGLFGLQSIELTLTPGEPGNNVPEPAGYALVGLALLAAGTANRRRA